MSLDAGSSAEAIRPVEEALEVSSDGVFKRGETAVVTGTLQPVDVALGEVLVAVADRCRHIDIFDVWSGAERTPGSSHQILETARPTGSNVEQAADMRRRQQPHHDPHRVVD